MTLKAVRRSSTGTTARPPQRRSAESWKQAFGAAVREARARAGLSQSETARRLGIAVAVYGRVERGLFVPGVKRLRELCQVLDTSPDKLLVLEYGTPPPTYHRRRKPVPTPGTPEQRRFEEKLRQLTPDQVKRLNLIAALLFG